MKKLISACVVAALYILLLSGCDAQVNGAWSPWQQDPGVDCCIWGGVLKLQRFCNNPYPENGGAACALTAGGTGNLEEVWKSCTCSCTNPSCDQVTSFCVNDTKQTSYCSCKYGYIWDVARDPFTSPYTCIADPTIEPVTTPEPESTLSSSTKDSLNAAHYFTVTWVLLFIIGSFVLHIVYMNFSPLRIIHMNQEICLFITYLFILMFIEKSSSSGLCRITSIFVHYFFLCCMTLFSVEALQTYSLVTYVVPRDGYLHRLINIGIGYCAPLLVMVFCLGFLWDKYGQGGDHCWCDMGTDQSWAFFMPITIAAFAATIIGEAQDQGSYEALPETDRSQFISAKSSSKTMMIVMLTGIFSYVLGLVAVDNQKVVCYAFFFIGNLIFGPAVLIGHGLAHPKIEDLIWNILGTIMPCWFKHKKRPGHGTVAPTPAQPGTGNNWGDGNNPADSNSDTTLGHYLGDKHADDLPPPVADVQSPIPPAD